MSKSTKPEGTTSYKETAFGILPRLKIVQLEKKGVAKSLAYILKLSNTKAKVTPKLICDVHKRGFGFISRKGDKGANSLDISNYVRTKRLFSQ